MANFYITNFASIVGPKEKNSHLSSLDLWMDDYYYGEKTFEQAEIKMQKSVIDHLLFKSGIENKQIGVMIGGDLSNQISVTSKSASEASIPFLGIYSACASFVEALIVASMYLKAHPKKKVLCLTSSHNLHAEKQFRFPIEYGAPKKLSSTYTTTAAIATMLSNEPSSIRLDSYTIGNAVDMGIKDTSNMGAIMAPAAAQTVMRHFKETKRDYNYYDVILTGDLGEVGSRIFRDYLKTTYQIDLKNHLDAGSEIYKKKDKNIVYSGGSGPCALPIYFFHKILKDKKYKKVLLVATGSLHNPLFVNQGQSVAGIAHAISLEVNL